MARIGFLKVHREWEDWAGIGLGVVIGLSPWLAGQAENRAVLIAATAIGLLVLALSELELVGLRRWLEVAAMACGAVLVALPFLMGYAGGGSLRYWHFALGALVILLATLELWQDWSLADDELAKHGR